MDCSCIGHKLLLSWGKFSILKVLASIVHQNKYMMAAGLVTHLRGLLDETINWCNERKQFGLHLREYTLVYIFINCLNIEAFNDLSQSGKTPDRSDGCQVILPRVHDLPDQWSTGLLVVSLIK